jgi:PKD repeat protein
LQIDLVDIGNLPNANNHIQVLTNSLVMIKFKDTKYGYYFVIFFLLLGHSSLLLANKPISDLFAPPDTTPYQGFYSDADMYHCAPAAVQFRGQVANSWSWTFPGGIPSNSSLQNPKVRYDNDGFYGVTLVVTRPGRTDSNLLLALRPSEMVRMYPLLHPQI